jgi:hypothetical protein
MKHYFPAWAWCWRPHRANLKGSGCHWISISWTPESRAFFCSQKRDGIRRFCLQCGLKHQ